jgi:ParB family chromosome partitioning protein
MGMPIEVERTAATFGEMKDIDLIDPSPLNPRKTFRQDKLEELRDSIISVGVVEPLIVRPGKRDRVEIVAGERRYRAAKMAGLTLLPCIVRFLDDAHVLELMAIENEQRDDIHPLERAAGYQALMKADATFTPETIAKRIGKSKRWVQLCLQYLTLIPEAQKAFREDRITAGHADLLVRLGPSEQGRALAACFEELSLIALSDDVKDAIHDAKYGDENPSKKGKKAPLVEIPQRLRSVRELGDWVDTHIKADPQELSLEFPELQDAMVEADNEDRKVVEISHLTRNELNKAQYSYDVKTVGDKTYDAEKEAARALRRVIFAPNWKRADGSKGTTPKDGYGGGMKDSPTCEHSALGVVTFGHDKGQSLTVCVAKQKCRVHWPAPEKRGSNGGGYGQSPEQRAAQEARWKAEQAERERQNKLWKEVHPALVAAVLKKATPAVTRAFYERALRNEIWRDSFVKTFALPLKVDVAAIERATLAKHPELAKEPAKAAAAAAPKPAAKKKPARQFLNKAASAGARKALAKRPKLGKGK